MQPLPPPGKLAAQFLFRIWPQSYNCHYFGAQTDRQLGNAHIIIRLGRTIRTPKKGKKFSYKFSLQNGSWFCDRVRLNFYAFARSGIYMAAKRAVM